MGETFDVETLVFQGQMDGGQEVVDRARAVQQAGPVDQGGDVRVAAAKRGGSLAVRRGQGDRVGRRVDMAVVGADRVGDLEVRVAEAFGDRVAQPARGGRTAQVDHKTGQFALPQPGANQLRDHRGRQQAQHHGLRLPQAAVTRVGAEETPVQAADV